MAVDIREHFSLPLSHARVKAGPESTIPNPNTEPTNSIFLISSLYKVLKLGIWDPNFVFFYFYG